MTNKIALGITQNNPGNIEYHPGVVWVGQSIPHKGGRYAWFSAPEFGMRAMMVILQNYQKRHGCNDLWAFISRWAPPPENNVEAYVADVVEYVGRNYSRIWNSTVCINTSQDDLWHLASAMVHHELGVVPYSMELWQVAFKLTEPHATIDSAPHM